MAKTTEQATEGMVAKVKNAGKSIGSGMKSAGAKAKAHVSRNRAAYIAGGAGLAAGGIAGAALTRKKSAQNED